MRRRRSGLAGWAAAAWLAALAIKRNFAIIATALLVPMMFVAIAHNPNW